jgi:hypothetical protein
VADALSSPLFSDVAVRLERATEHLASIDAALAAFGARPADPVRLQQQADSVLIRFIVDEPIPRSIGIYLGEAVHQLRSALDNTAFVLMKQATKHITDHAAVHKLERDCQFPICDTLESFVGNAFRIGGLSQGVRDVVESVQPYQDAHQPIVANPLRILRELSNADKHRLLTPLHGVTSHARVELTPGAAHYVVFVNSALSYNDVAGKVYFPAGVPVHVRLRLRGGIAVVLFDQGTLLGGVGPILEDMILATTRAIELMVLA